MAVTFSAEEVWARISPRLEAAVTDTLLAATEAAREKAPVRKVFKGSVGHASLQSVEEAASEAAVRSHIGLAPGPVRTQRTPAARVHRFGPRRLLVRPAFDPKVKRFRASSGQFAPRGTNKLLFNTPLTSRGRYELKTGRANITTGGKSYLGGRLRSEITHEPVSGADGIWTGAVLSPTPYAKYVEFGTRYSRAQPYLRPALAEQRAAFRSRIAAAMR